jgi:LacI family transcriptional regulator
LEIDTFDYYFLGDSKKDMNIYDIAKEAGVSASTVSRVINDKKGVRKETKERVLKCLEMYHYSPNETARGLVNQASKMIGILISDIRSTHHTDGVHYMEGEFVKLGYCCIIMNTGSEDQSKAKYIQILSQRRVEAVALIGSTFQNELVKMAISKYLPTIPIVIANGYLDLPNVYGVISDEQSGITNCVKYLSDKNRKKLAFIIDKFTPSNNLKLQGFEMGVRQFYKQAEPLVVKCESSIQSSYDATYNLVKEHPEVDGIIYVVDLLAVGGSQALHDLKVKVPKQIAIIGVDNSIYSEICSPRLTSLDNKLLDLSITSARNLMDALQGKHVTKNMMIMSSIVEREST